MEIIKNNTSELEATLIIKINESDFAENLEKELKKVRKSANIKGFRPGKVPIGMIKKMYGEELKAQELNKYLDEQLNAYLRENKIDLVGDFLPSTKEETKIDLKNDKEFQFVFDIGFYPETEIKEEELEVPVYKIQIEEKTIDEEIENLLEKYGDFEEIEEVTEKCQIRATLIELDEDKPKEEGIKIEEGLILIRSLDEKTQKQLEKAKKEQKFTINVKEAFTNEVDLAGLLRIAKEELENVNPNFELTIEKIEEYQKGRLNQDFYNKLFGEDEVKTEDELREKLREIIGSQYERETKVRFSFDLKQELKSKVEMKLPVEFIERWQANRRKDADKEQIHKEIDQMVEILKWDRILMLLSDKHNLKVEDTTVIDTVKHQIANQLQQMGMSTQMFTDEQMDHFAAQELEKMSDSDRYILIFSIMEGQVSDKLFDIVKKEEKEVTFDQLKAIYEEENKKIAEEKKEQNADEEKTTEDKETEK